MPRIYIGHCVKADGDVLSLSQCMTLLSGFHNTLTALSSTTDSTIATSSSGKIAPSACLLTRPPWAEQLLRTVSHLPRLGRLCLICCVTERYDPRSACRAGTLTSAGCSFRYATALREANFSCLSLSANLAGERPTTNTTTRSIHLIGSGGNVTTTSL
jgi:hypothetical protein